MNSPLRFTPFSLRALLALFAAATLSLPALTAATDNDESARQLRLEKFVLPEYPTMLQHEGVTAGTVVLAVTHDAVGKPTDIFIVEASRPEFADAVREAVRDWRFAPPAASTAVPTVPLVRFYFSSKGFVLMSMPSAANTAATAGLQRNGPVELPDFAELDAKPNAVQQPMPRFPAALAGRVTKGTANVRFFVDAEGRARVPVVTDASSPEFAAAAAAAVAQWRFDPPRLNGKPVVAVERWSFKFGPNSGS